MSTKMKTNEIRGLSVLGMAVLMAAAVSCKKGDDGASAPEPAHGVFRAEAPSQAGDSKTQMLNNLDVVWSDNDQIRVFDKAHTGQTFTLVSGGGESKGEFAEPTGLDPNFYDGSYTAVYPSENARHVSGEVYELDIKQEQHYTNEDSFGNGANPMAAKSSTPNLAFQNLFGTLRLNLQNAYKATVNSIKVTSKKNESLWGKCNVSFDSDGKPVASMAANSGSNSVTLVCDKPVELTASGRAFNIVLPAGTLQGGFDIEVFCTTAFGKSAVFTKGVGGSVDNSINVGRIRNMKELPIEVGFVIDGKAIGFADGNLYWEPDPEWTPGEEQTEADNPGIWDIEEHPWEYGVLSIDEEAHTGMWDENHVSHFYWTSDPAKARVQEYDGTGESTTDKFFMELSDFPEIDGHKWCVLTKDEWQKILTGSRVPGNNNHAWAKVWLRHAVEGGEAGSPGVKDVKGLLLFPNEWYLSTTGLPDGFVELNGNAFNGNTDWTKEVNVVEAGWLENGEVYEGCVFLPCVGSRDGFSDDGSAIQNVGTGGYYWLSTLDASNYAYYVGFNSTNFITFSYYRSYARCVRPVRVLGN